MTDTDNLTGLEPSLGGEESPISGNEPSLPGDFEILRSLILTAQLEIARNDGGRMREDLQKAIARMGSDALPILERTLEDPDARIRRASVIALGMLGSTDGIIPLLTRSMDDLNNAVRQAARRQLQHIGAPADVTPGQLHEWLLRHRSPPET